MLENLRALLSKHNLDITPEWNTAKPIREGSEWFIGKKADGAGYIAWFGDFARNLTLSWTSGDAVSDDPVAQGALKAALKMEALTREKYQVDVAMKLFEEWESFSTEGETPYLKRKGLNQLFGARVMNNPYGDSVLVVPMRDSNDLFWNYQRIYAQKLSKGDKFFSAGARIEGCFHVLRHGGRDEIHDGGPAPAQIIIAEGFATAASIAAALNICGMPQGTPEAGNFDLQTGATPSVVCAFNANNLLAVSRALREKFPEAKIIIAADNDAFEKDGSARKYNTGLEKGREAAIAVNAELRFPQFKEPKPGLTDFNDLMVAEGLDQVRAQILEPAAQQDASESREIEPLPVVFDGKKPKKLTQAEVSRHLHGTIKYKDKTLRDRQGNLFIFAKTHWVESFKKDGEVLSDLNLITHEKLGYRQLTEHYDHFALMAPRAPEHVNLHVPNPMKANFQNGTLHLTKGEFSFTPGHDPGHYLNSVLPLEYTHWAPGDELPPAPEFDAWLERIFRESPDRAQLITFYHELVGAALMPYHPVIVHFWGPPASGKSTLIKFIAKLIGAKNCSIVQPCAMEKDALTSMMGKLLNYHTDISVNKPMVEEVMKTIQDRIPLTITRKYMEAIIGPMPYFHLFGSNGPMVTRDGASQAMGRRAYEIYTPGWGAQGDEGLDFEERILRDPVEMKGVLARALKSLYERNKRRGHFIRIESSAERIREMELSSDYVGQFLRDIRNGDIDDAQTALGFKNGTLKRSQTWTFFQNWFKDAHPQRRGMPKYEFFKAMEKKGFHAQKLHGHQVYKGLDTEAHRASMT